jgi:hypothetical protein
MYKYDGMVTTLGFFVVIIALIGAVVGAQSVVEGDDEPPGYEEVSEIFKETRTGYTGERGETEETLSTTDLTGDFQRLTEIQVTLTWQDEAPSGVGSNLQTNEPDQFSVSITSPWEESMESEIVTASQGSVSTKFTVEEESEEETTGEWIITVICGESGDTWGRFGIRKVSDDTGNDWSLAITVDYMVRQEVEAVETLSVQEYYELLKYNYRIDYDSEYFFL